MRDFERTRMNQARVSIDGSPSPAIAMIDEGNALEEQGRITEAMARYDAAVQVDPQRAEAHLNRGNILLAGAQCDEARSAYELAIAATEICRSPFQFGYLHPLHRRIRACITQLPSGHRHTA